MRIEITPDVGIRTNTLIIHFFLFASQEITFKHTVVLNILINIIMMLPDLIEFIIQKFKVTNKDELTFKK